MASVPVSDPFAGGGTITLRTQETNPEVASSNLAGLLTNECMLRQPDRSVQEKLLRKSIRQRKTIPGSPSKRRHLGCAIDFMHPANCSAT
jgi:hypothetical protein